MRFLNRHAVMQQLLHMVIDAFQLGFLLARPLVHSALLSLCLWFGYRSLVRRDAVVLTSVSEG